MTVKRLGEKSELSTTVNRCTQWRHRPTIEPTSRFQQEAGWEVEDLRVHSLEAMRRLFVLVLLTALFVAHLDQRWPAPALSWLRSLGDK